MGNRYPLLLSPGNLGRLTLDNHMIMSPMTRFRIDLKGVPLASNATYYSQRASAGLIITESAYIEPRGIQDSLTAGIHSAAQVSGWSEVSAAVHGQGGRVFCQLAHAGRLSHSSLQPDGALPIAPSPTADGVKIRVKGEEDSIVRYEDGEIPRELAQDEIQDLVKEHGRAARRAINAGFDGVELHAGSGHLLRQFLEPCSNHRKDKYGGSAIKRCRFVIETVEEVVDSIGKQQVGIKISPNFSYGGMKGSLESIRETYAALCAALAAFDLAYIHVQRPMLNMQFGPQDYDPVRHIRALYRSNMLAGGNFNRHSGEQALREGICDFIVFGRRFLANPDLPTRFELDAPENSWDDSTLYTHTDTGFLDYPALSCAEKAKYRS
ncbi:MAG: alkene reductase [Parahaliea sp.]